MTVTPMPREKWTDERLDDLNAKVDRGFADTKVEFRELRSEMNARFDKVDARFETMNRTLIAGLFVVIAAIIGSNVF
jgi:hypothetical protein